MKVQVTDLIGRMILEIKGNQAQEMEVGFNSEPGIYFVSVNTSNGIETKKIYMK